MLLDHSIRGISDYSPPIKALAGSASTALHTTSPASSLSGATSISMSPARSFSAFSALSVTHSPSGTSTPVDADYQERQAAKSSSGGGYWVASSP